MNKPKYWRGLEELEQTPEFLENASKEFPTDISMEDALSKASDKALGFESNRRDFLKVLGFGVSAATLAACAEGPVKKAIPYVQKPVDIIPGVANWYASTAPTGTPVLVKTREGRPIKLEGNPDSSFSGGGLSAIGQSTVLDLYDIDRLQAPTKGTNATTWDELDSNVAQALEQVKARGTAVRLVSGTVMSPSTQQIINDFLGQFADAKHVTYDAVSTSAIAQAHEAAFGVKATPSYKFGEAKVVVSFGADFLGTWLNPVGFSNDYIKLRDPDKPMSRHLQFESLMSLTGAKADMRFPLNPSQEGKAVVTLYNKVASKLGKPGFPAVSGFETAMNGLEKAAADLVSAQGASLVVSGSNDVAVQAIVAGINEMLGNYGKTLDIDNPMFVQQGDDAELAALAKEVEAGSVGAVLFLDANPVYNTPYAESFKTGLANAGTFSVSFAWKADETSELCTYTAPNHHFLESWGDVQQSATQVSLVQPTIHPLFKTRQVQQSLLKWSGSDVKFHTFLKRFWEDNFFSRQTQYLAFNKFWNETLRKGVLELPANAAAATLTGDLSAFANQAKQGQEPAAGQFDLVFYQKVGIRDGAGANNPWLQELPDPMTKVTWDNYVTFPVATAKELGIKDEDVVKISVGGTELALPVVIQPGQAKNTLGIALGYGSKKAGRVAVKANGEQVAGMQVAGADVYPFVGTGEARQYFASGVTVAKTGQTYQLARTQTFNTLYDPQKGERFGQDFDRTERIIEETTSANYANGEYADRVKLREERKKHLVTLWDSHFEDPETSRTIHWKMAIDLNKCTGCGACVVSCHAENNVPVVGKQEVMTRREMHWIRIDRYYSGNQDNPDVVFQPMMCQHCDNAPCETVCPVLATIHSDEGLNQMAYNRCVGTRYCANNCPYKVRRFNWFNYYNDETQFGDYYTHNDLGRLVLNPDVTVRFRGVMEKCSFCVQRLQEGKLRAKVNSKSTFAKPEDGEIQTACQQSCPTGAIVFGDFNDQSSEVNKLYREDRTYLALEDVKTLPSVGYQALVRNRTEAETKEKLEELHEARSYMNWDNAGHGAEHAAEGHDA
ncbi:TAT-variant-translocated molybdopterin oxidoreductase [Pontibacter sp. G13]|nr:TAT-variant-translocated molybdopterin oxidoreductase [Pontibacter sp. G13]WNJ16599.1 TAT-variant-translocated molybdopterin oxidoreductase [Pontibacter sp. G13]